MQYTYSRWDGSQHVSDVTADDLIEAVADMLLAGHSLQAALRQVVEHGLRARDTVEVPGLAALAERIRAARQRVLDGGGPREAGENQHLEVARGEENSLRSLSEWSGEHPSGANCGPSAVSADRSEGQPPTAARREGRFSGSAPPSRLSPADSLPRPKRNGHVTAPQPPQPGGARVLNPDIAAWPSRQNAAHGQPQRDSAADKPCECKDLTAARKGGANPGETGTDALDGVRQIDDFERVEQGVARAQAGEAVDVIDLAAAGRVLDPDLCRSLRQICQYNQVLEDAGYACRAEESLLLSARGARKLGDRALQDIFRRLKPTAPGCHRSRLAGWTGERAESSRPYEFGDPLYLDLNRTVMNAIQRGGPGVPVSLTARDFAVFQAESLVQASTVLVLDASPSMVRRRCAAAATQLALALGSLIRSRFARDRLHVVGFAERARVLDPGRLPGMRWPGTGRGTNMHHGLMLARQLLARDRSTNKQIVLITDGEPTAHIQDGETRFAYPPSERTLQHTLLEVRRCTREGITINVFMLSRSGYLTEFVHEMTRVNGGRAFFTSPERLGEYVLVDYLSRRGVTTASTSRNP